MHFKLYLANLSNWTLDRFEIRSMARSKVAIMIPLLDFFKMWHVPVFHSAGHINFVVRLLLALHPGKP